MMKTEIIKNCNGYDVLCNGILVDTFANHQKLFVVRGETCYSSPIASFFGTHLILANGVQIDIRTERFHKSYSGALQQIAEASEASLLERRRNLLPLEEHVKRARAAAELCRILEGAKPSSIFVSRPNCSVREYASHLLRTIGAVEIYMVPDVIRPGYWMIVSDDAAEKLLKNPDLKVIDLNKLYHDLLKDEDSK